MTEIVRSNFQNHPFHLVSPSPWPLYTSISLFSLAASGALSMHSFSNSYNAFYLALITVVFSMSFWFRDIISEGTFLGNHTLSVQKGLNLGVILFIVSEYFFLDLIWIVLARLKYVKQALVANRRAPVLILSGCPRLSFSSSRYYSTTSSPPSLTDDESTHSKEGGTENDTPEDLANRYQGNLEGLHTRIESAKDDVSVNYVQKVRDLEARGLDSGLAKEDWVKTEEYQGERDNLIAERDKNLKALADLHYGAKKIIDSREPETDYDDWTTRENSPASENSSNRKDEELPSSSSEAKIENPSSKRSLEEAGESSSDSANKRLKTNNSSSSTGQESSSTSATDGRFKQDSSDVMPDSEPLDFDDPTG